MFSLADAGRTRILLDEAGFEQVVIGDITTKIILGGGGDVSEALDFLLGTGIARAIFDSAPPDATTPAIEAVRMALSEHFEPGVGVRLGARAWMVTATA